MYNRTDSTNYGGFCRKGKLLSKIGRHFDKIVLSDLTSSASVVRFYDYYILSSRQYFRASDTDSAAGQILRSFPNNKHLRVLDKLKVTYSPIGIDWFWVWIIWLVLKSFFI